MAHHLHHLVVLMAGLSHGQQQFVHEMAFAQAVDPFNADTDLLVVRKQYKHTMRWKDSSSHVVYDSAQCLFHTSVQQS